MNIINAIDQLAQKPDDQIVRCTEKENQISILCDQLMQHVPSPCAREIIFQIRNLAGAGKYTKTGSCANGNGIGEH